MATETKKEQRIIHQRHDLMYVSPEERRCIVCNEKKALKCFDPIQRTDGVHVLQECLMCVEKRRLAVAKSKQASATENMVGVLSKALKRPVSRNEGPSMAEFADKLITAMGGMDNAAGTIGKLTIDTLTDKGTPPSVAVKYAHLVTDMLSVLHRNRDEPIDLSQLSEDDLTNVLMEPAKKLIMTDEKFCLELLGDATIRRKLLADMGIDVLDVKPEE